MLMTAKYLLLIPRLLLMVKVVEGVMVGMVEKEASGVQVGMEEGEELEGPMVEMQEMEGLGEKVEQEQQVVMGGMAVMLDSLPLLSTISALKMQMVLLFG